MLPSLLRITVWSAAMAAVVGAGVSTASAQSAMCTTHEKMTGALGDKFGEKRRAIGLVSNSGLMEVYVSEKGTWTVILTNPAKMACIVAAGHSWDEPPAPKVITGIAH